MAIGLMGVVVARALGPAGAGGFSILLATLLLVTFLSTLGIDLGVAYHVGGGRWRPADALRQSQAAAGVLAIAGGAVALVAVESGAAGAFDHVPLAALVVTLLALPGAISLTYSAQLALALSRYRAYAIAVALPSVIGLVLIACLAPPFGLTAAAAGLLAAYSLVAGAVLLWWLRQLPRSSPALRGEGIRVRTAAAFGIRTNLGNALQLVNYRADLFILNAVAIPAVVGRYAIATSVTTAGVLLPRALAAVVMPRIAELGTSAPAPEREAAIARTVRHAGVLVAASVLALAAALQAIPLVYGESFRPAISLGLLLLPGVAAIGLSNSLAAAIVGSGLPSYTLYAGLIVTPPTVALYLVLINAVGARGAALASSASYITTMLVTYFFFRRATGVRRLRVLLPGRAELRDYAALLSRLRSRRPASTSS